MKRVYFVRHGSTQGNEVSAYQLATLPLSDKGKEQAERVTQRFGHIPIDVIIASTMERAAETARAIAQRVGREVVLEPLFQEILRPTTVRGKLHADPEASEIMQMVVRHWANADWRHSDEENFFDLKQRALKALAYLIARPEERILVVTHGTILCMLFCCMMAGEAFEPEHFSWAKAFLAVSNTGITWCEHDKGTWKLITWNDQAHLG